MTKICDALIQVLRCVDGWMQDKAEILHIHSHPYLFVRPSDAHDCR